MTDCISDTPMFFQIRPYDWTNEGVLNVFDFSSRAEFATQPACKAMVCFMHVGSFELEDEGGITLQYLLERLSQFWTGCSKETFDKLEDKSTVSQLGTGAGYYDDLYDHDVWNGWHEPFLRDDGFVQMGGGPYDS
ncbi:hypothetical protein JCM11251_006927 [Rhodosporidiobolus azoricus]